MIQIICAVRDAKSETFGAPIFVRATGVAIRSFTQACNNESAENQFRSHAEDFSLWELGTYDEITGKLESLEIPKLLITAQQVIYALPKNVTAV